MTNQRVLVVQENDATRAMVQVALESLGAYRVLALASAQAALTQAAGFDPHVIIMDVAMTGMDGPQAFDALRRNPALRGVPVVFLTPHTRAQQVSQLRALGAADVIATPFEPRHLCERVAAVLAATAGAPVAGQGPVALVVEDDRVMRYLLGYVLAQQGWRMVEMADGPQGLAAITAGPVTDAVLLDIMLPGIDGLTLLGVLKSLERWHGVPVMMLTAKGDEASVQRALAAGASDYVGKPFDLADLAERLRRLPRRPGTLTSSG